MEIKWVKPGSVKVSASFFKVIDLKQVIDLSEILLN